MSAPAARTPAGPLATALAVMAASTSLRHRAWMGVCLALLAVVALAIVFVARDANKTPAALTVLVAFANVMLWSGWFSRLALLQTQTSQWCMPGIRVAVARTLLLGACATVVVPGAALVLLGGADPLQAIGLPMLGALGGLLFVLVPWPLACALVMLPSIGASMLRPLIERFVGTDASWSPSDLLLPALVCTALLVVWRWSAVVRMRDLDAVPQWLRPVVLARPQNAMDFGATPDKDVDSNAWQARAGWLAPVTRADDAGPHDPASAIGACLGGTMGRVAPREAVKQWALVTVLVAAALLFPLRDDSVLVRDALLIGGLVGLLATGWILALRLHRQRLRPAGEFSELALLPGLGGPDSARDALLRCLRLRLGRLLLVALAVQLLLVWLRAMPAVHVALMGLLWIGVCAGSLLLCATVLAGRRLDSARLFFTMLPLVILTITTLMLAFFRVPPGGTSTALFVCWCLSIPAYAAAALPLLRAFRAQPHAFLTP